METTETAGMKIERGRRAPQYNLEVAVQLLEELHANIGDGPYGGEHVARALHLSPGSGTANIKIGALTHFGLLTREGGVYKVSDLGKRIVLHTTEEERTQAIREAVRCPSLFQDVFQDFANKPFPKLLGNLLAQKYNVSQKAREDVARVLRESVEFAGLLPGGILAPTDGGDSEKIPSAERIAERSPGSPPPQATAVSYPAVASPTCSMQTYTVPLDLEGRVATLMIPVPVKKHDLLAIASWANWMSTSAVGKAESPNTSEG